MPALARGSMTAADGQLNGGANAAFAQIVGDRTAKFASYAVPGSDALCEALYADGAGGGATCVPIDVATERGISMVAGGEVYGIVPDWVHRVEVKGRDGTVEGVDVVGNGYHAKWSLEGTASIRLIGANGRTLDTSA